MPLRALSPEELLARCDLAGVARVVSVGRASPTAPNLAKLLFLEIEKGAVRGADGRPAAFAHVRLHGGAAMVGGWSDWWDYPVGFLVRTHLDWNERDGVHETTWPGAVSELDPAAPFEDLPAERSDAAA
jgi:hypothetical protein